MGEVGSLCKVSEPRMLDRLTIRPAGDFLSSGNKVCVRRTTAKKFTSKVSRKICGDTELAFLTASPPSLSTPALLTKMSRRPYPFSKYAYTALSVSGAVAS